MVGTKKWKATYQPPGQNPFHPRGITHLTKTVDIDETVPRDQVETFAREAAEGNTFIKVEEVS